MITIVRKSIPLFLIPVFILFNAALPKVCAQTLFNNLNAQPKLVYSFVFIPILEISVLIAEHLMPQADINGQETSSQDTNNAKQRENASLVYLFNSTAIEPIILKFSIIFVIAFISFCFGGGIFVKPGYNTYSRNVFIPQITALIFLFPPMLARSDVPH